jgi:hypothetical protein
MVLPRVHKYPFLSNNKRSRMASTCHPLKHPLALEELAVPRLARWVGEKVKNYLVWFGL